ncbi:MAG: HPF/RaiA family ribosome-associated protein [Gemmatimonadetes bacterium]|nr:HPF/RaiA family ribosome-associated protein [Gemmatimonadota bacterium]
MNKPADREPVRISVTVRGFDLDVATAKRIEAALDRMRRFEPLVSGVDAVFTSDKRGFRAEALATIDRQPSVRARAAAGDPRTAFDRLEEKLRAQLTKQRDRRKARRFGSPTARRGG